MNIIRPRIALTPVAAEREKFYLFCMDENDVHGCGNLRDLARGGERAGGLVNAENHDVVGFLIGGQQELSCWIQREISRSFTLGGEIAGWGQCSTGRIDREFGDTVVAAI